MHVNLLLVLILMHSRRNVRNFLSPISLVKGILILFRYSFSIKTKKEKLQKKKTEIK